MIALLSYSTNLLGNNHNSFTGVVESQDSILISYDDLRTVNSKLIELEYEKEINNKLRLYIDNNQTIISNYDSITNAYIRHNREITSENKKLRRRNTIASSISVVAIIGLIISLIK